MAHKQQIDFLKKIQKKYYSYLKNVKVLDVGSLDINGNNRWLFDGVKEYIGLDVGIGKNVDVVSRCHEYNPNFKFDVIISTEMLEHDEFWEKSINNIINLLKKDGMFILTCASTGRLEHGTIRTSKEDNPLMLTNYYKNITKEDIMSIIDVDNIFKEYFFEFNKEHSDLYFLGIKS